MIFAIITAGGIGHRMSSSIPKQFIEIDSTPVIVHTIRRFESSLINIRFIVTLPEDYFQLWNDIVEKFLSTTNIITVKGGETRFHSVRNALNAISELDGIVSIHDAVRPFVPLEVIGSSIESAKKFGSGVAAVFLKESIRQLGGSKISIALDRNNYQLVQTPQSFNLKKIRDIYNSVNSENFTDDASVWESGGQEVYLVEGSHQNIKITLPEDMSIAEAIYKYQKDSKTSL